MASTNAAEKIQGINDYEWTYTEEPHATRRDIIQKAHPEVKKLFGPDPRAKYWCFATVMLQIICACYCARASTSWLQFCVIGYVIGGTCNHSLTLAIHEMSHNLFFKSAKYNVYFSYVANWPLVIPYSASFKKYHLEHHRYQGVDGVDTDVPTAFEGFFFTSPFRKFLWVLFQPFFYAIRPLVVNPKPLEGKDFLNILTQATFLLALYRVGGPGALGYLLFSTFFGLGMHPCAGHFISEHYTNIASSDGVHKTGHSPIRSDGVEKGDKLYPDETFSYRGILNLVSYNVGYHVAHHDFPYVPGSRLREVEKLAPEYYEHLPSTKSWPGTIYTYIMSEGTPFDRVKRHCVTGEQKKTK